MITYHAAHTEHERNRQKRFHTGRLSRMLYGGEERRGSEFAKAGGSHREKIEVPGTSNIARQSVPRGFSLAGCRSRGEGLCVRRCGEKRKKKKTSGPEEGGGQQRIIDCETPVHVPSSSIHRSSEHRRRLFLSSCSHTPPNSICLFIHQPLNNFHRCCHWPSPLPSAVVSPASASSPHCPISHLFSFLHLPHS